MVNVNIQLFGGRGSASGGGGGGTGDPMSVPFDKWGKFIDNQDIPDPTGEYSDLGYIKDEYRYTSEEFTERITKKEIMDVVEAYKNDDGTYGTGDEQIMIFYKNGDHLTLTESDTGKYKKSDIVGVSVSTGDDEYVWGKEVSKRTGQSSPLELWTPPENEGQDDRAYTTNAHSGYKTTGQYIVRTKTLWRGRQTRDGYWHPSHEIIRKSTIKPVKD